MASHLSAYPSLFRRLALLDYPLPLKLHAYLLLGLGVGLTFIPETIITSPLLTGPARWLNLPTDEGAPQSSASKPYPPARPGQRISAASRRDLSLAGLLALGLGLSYVGTSAFVARPEDNQLLYAAIPLRYMMSLMATLSWLSDREGRSLFKLTIMTEDALGATWMLWCMRGWPLWTTFVG